MSVFSSALIFKYTKWSSHRLGSFVQFTICVISVRGKILGLRERERERERENNILHNEKMLLLLYFELLSNKFKPYLVLRRFLSSVQAYNPKKRYDVIFVGFMVKYFISSSSNSMGLDRYQKDDWNQREVGGSKKRKIEGEILYWMLRSDVLLQ
jgi:hypothetical protein